MSSSSRNPLQANSTDLTGVDISINANHDGLVDIDFGIASTESISVINELEVTHYVNFPKLPTEIKERNAIYAGLLAKLDSENGKHCIMVDPAYSSELLGLIEQRRPGYTDNLVNNTNLLYASPTQINPSSDLSIEYKLHVLKKDNSADGVYCSAVARFQKGRLIEMRPSLSNAAAQKKMDERYSEEAILKKVQSDRVIVFSAMQQEEIIATITLNLHWIESNTALNKTAYLSDLLISKEFIINYPFIIQWMTLAMKWVSKEFPQIETLTLMAPGNPHDPLVKCVEKLKEAGLFSVLKKDAQIKFGMISYFVQAQENQPVHNKLNSPANLFYHSTCYEELGIFIELPSDLQLISQKLNQEIADRIHGIPGVRLNTGNIYHISLFQGRFPKNLISQLISGLDAISALSSSFEIKMIPEIDNIKLNLFWDTEVTASIKKLHNDVLECGLKYRNGMMRQFEEIYLRLLPSTSDGVARRAMLDQIGTFGTGQQYKPHITLYYISGSDPEVDAAIKNIKIPDFKFMATKIAVGRLGYHGNVIEMLREFPLQNVLQHGATHQVNTRKLY